MSAGPFDPGPPVAPAPELPTIAARVPAGLKARLRDAASARGVDASVVIREAVEAYLAPADPTGVLRGGQGAARRDARPTARAAALAVAPRVGSQRYRALTKFMGAGDDGLTTDEVCVAIPELPVNGLARRVTDLLQAGFIRPAAYVGTSSPVTRTTRAGAQAQVWVITDKGAAAWRESYRRDEAD